MKSVFSNVICKSCIFYVIDDQLLKIELISKIFLENIEKIKGVEILKDFFYNLFFGKICLVIILT